MTLLAFFLGGITGAGEFEKFVGEVVIGFRHGGERGGEGGEEMEVPGQLDYKYFVIFCSSYAKHYKPHSIVPVVGYHLNWHVEFTLLLFSPPHPAFFTRIPVFGFIAAFDC